MGKKQHQKDKLYLTATEWRTLYGGKRANDEYHTHQERLEFKRLPFDYCSLSLQPFRDPYCTSNGVIYDITEIVPFLKKFGFDPCTGEKIEFKHLTKLIFHKNNDDKYHCPVLFKVFNENTHIVAIKTTGNVFSYEAVEQLNFKTNHLFDLLNDKPFTKKDVIDLQNPLDLTKFNINDFYYFKNKIEYKDSDEQKSNLRIINNETKETLKELSTIEDNEFLKKLSASSQLNSSKQVKTDRFNAAHYSTGQASASFTSTVMPVVSKIDAASIDQYEIRYPYVKKKGYVRLVTNFGNLNLELYCDKVPRTCDNFILLCNRSYYDNCKFHRLIKNFMVQGGDPTATGKGGQSAFEKPFNDEICKLYSHEGRGVLSMANKGPNTNQSQFFITFRSCKYLDGKHTIFGRLVGGLDVLSKIESIETDEKDKPKEDVIILKTVVFVDPYKEAEKMIEEERAKDDERHTSNAIRALKTEETKTQPIRKGVGSLISLDAIHKRNAVNASNDDNYEDNKSNFKSKKIKTTGGFGDFKNW
ncbi:RING-type E3 ubiquitin-protein ligase PPIL2 [Sarcoptes scabiei]|nr:RING-type E3 ubiquitin-protein ligase PPIL2 [Sarcoptes scabiei]UXI16044.1 DnaJ-like protein subfamily B member 11 [Sarcoptes scabiei]